MSITTNESKLLVGKLMLEDDAFILQTLKTCFDACPNRNVVRIHREFMTYPSVREFLEVTQISYVMCDDGSLTVACIDDIEKLSLNEVKAYFNDLNLSCGGCYDLRSCLPSQKGRSVFVIESERDFTPDELNEVKNLMETAGKTFSIPDLITQNKDDQALYESLKNLQNQGLPVPKRMFDELYSQPELTPDEKAVNRAMRFV